MPRTDCHAHVFALDVPLTDDRRYTPPRGADVADYLANLDAHGLARGVLVQPSFLGTDNRQLMAALDAHRDRLRGIAVVDVDTPDWAFDELAASGVVGIRLNLIGKPVPALRGPAWRALLATLAARDWHVEVHTPASTLRALLPPLLDAGLRVVVDHFGRPDPAAGVDDPGFRDLLSFGASGATWVKLSGAYRLGAQGDAIVRRAAPMLVDAFGPSRLVWGSDWPHTQFQDTLTYATTVRQLEGWLTDASVRQTVLAESPAALYGRAIRSPAH